METDRDMSVDIKSTVKLFADDTSLFSIVHDPNTLAKISEWAYQWKMLLNPDQNKQAQENNKIISPSNQFQ